MRQFITVHPIGGGVPIEYEERDDIDADVAVTGPGRVGSGGLPEGVLTINMTRNGSVVLRDTYAPGSWGRVSVAVLP